MRLIILYFVLYLLSFAMLANAQTVKPKFKELTLAFYQPNDSAKTLGITMYAYYKINSDGIIHFIFNEFNTASHNFTGITRDTSYQLSDKMIIELNKIFNGEKNLRSYMVIDKLPKGVIISGPGNFITYKTDNGKTDNLIFSQSFFGANVNLVLNRIFFAQLARTTHSGKIYHDRALEAQIIKYHKACNCIPKTEEPPTVKELPVGIKK